MALNNKLQKITRVFLNLAETGKLHKENLTLGDYNAVGYMLDQFHKGERVIKNVICENAVKFFKKYDFQTKYHDGRWDISIE